MASFRPWQTAAGAQANNRPFPHDVIQSPRFLQQSRRWWRSAGRRGRRWYSPVAPDARRKDPRPSRSAMPKDTTQVDGKEATPSTKADQVQQLPAVRRQNRPTQQAPARLFAGKPGWLATAGARLGQRRPDASAWRRQQLMGQRSAPWASPALPAPASGTGQNLTGAPEALRDMI